jgi:hypothetical protein
MIPPLMHTVSEASECWCPFVRVVRSGDYICASHGEERIAIDERSDSDARQKFSRCIGDHCMMCREFDTDGLGYCGLAGVPPMRRESE